ncbi:MAG: hypothetical protein AB7E80_17130 [Hyphomicrobiaceae bacterium]
MGDDDKKNLPAARYDNVPARPGGDYLTSPVRGRSLIGRAVSRFVARLNAATIRDNIDQVSALQDYAKARGALADATLDAELRIRNYVEHRDDLIQEQHEAHLDRMEENRHQRDLNRRRREQTLLALDGSAARSAIEEDYDLKIARAKKEAELAEAAWQADRARWGREAFNQTLPLRREKIEHLYKTGALDEELDRLLREREIATQRSRMAAAAGPGSTPCAENSTVAQLLREIDEEIELAHRTHASDEIKATLYAMRARLQSKLADRGTQSE